MAKKMRYYRTAALLGPTVQPVAFRGKPRPIKIPWQAVAWVVVIAGIALWGPLQFPGDFWLPLTMAFLGVGFGSYALYQHRSRFPKGSP